jgi:ribosomal protein L37E
MYDLSVVIPARCEMFLSRTIEDILEHSTANTEIITVLDGAWADPVIPQNPRVTVVYHEESIGQRAACNEAVRLSSAKYVMKVDAHCSFAQGFDTVLLNDMQDDWTVVPTMRNLWAFDWKCKKCGKRTYQGPTPTACSHCGCANRFTRRMVWEAKRNPQSNSYCFDSTPHFQYMKEYSKRPEGQGDLTETMSLQGSCFMLTRDKWWELNICDESLGSWGSQGIEVAVKTWLSGGRVLVNHKTYYAHLFRTQGGDFSFPYPMSGNQVERAKTKIREMIYSNSLPKQTHPLSWLLEKFWPIPGWDSIPEDSKWV